MSSTRTMKVTMVSTCAMKTSMFTSNATMLSTMAMMPSTHTSNLNISKVAGEGVIKLLTPADRVAVNDASGTDAPAGGWAVPMQDVVDKAAIDWAIDTMNPVDPMSDKPALTGAYNALQHTNVKIEHIIVLALALKKTTSVMRGEVQSLRQPKGVREGDGNGERGSERTP
jgi:hypothetical protein